MINAWAGGPELEAKRQWIQDTVRFAQEQHIDLGDLGQQILLSLAHEIGTWKIIAILLAFLLITMVGSVYGVLKLLKSRK